MTVRKAVILAAGFGTRLLPATKVVPKEMLPIVDRPVIQYIVEECLAAGLDQIIMVTSSAKRAIEDHFDRQHELEETLVEAGKLSYLEEVRRTADIDMMFVRQKQRRGNGHAVLMAREIVRDEPFAVFFPDDVIFHDTPAIGQLLAVYERHGGTVLGVQQVPQDQVNQYGIITPEQIADRTYRVHGVVEKPPPGEAPSNLATVGRFVVTPDLIDVLDQTSPGRSGEIWLMDAFELLRQRQPVFAYEYEGLRFDCGQPLGLLKAGLYAAMRNEALGPEIKAYARELGLY